MSNSRIPTSILPYFAWVRNTNAYIIAGGPPTNGTRLGFSAAHIADWNVKAEVTEALAVVYNNPVLFNSIIAESVRHDMHNFGVFARPLLNIVAASPAATDTDAHTFNLILDKNHAGPSHETSPIPDTVMAEVKPIGGGDVLVTCRSNHDDKHASKHIGADSVQVSFKLDGEPPVGVNDGTHKEIFSRARFIMHLGTENVGKKLYVFLRWYNMKHPDLAGPWGQMITISLA